jgi:hypothetical protein
MPRISAHAAPAAAVAGIAALVAVASPASATAIGPNQHFAADVNGRTTSPAPIQMGCIGPITPGETGHPLAGQYVEVLPTAGTSFAVGFTGSLGDAIDVSIVYSTGNVTVVSRVGTLTGYDTKLAISTSLVLPCAGTGTAVFEPTPTSPTAVAADLTVDFIGQP